MTLDTPCTTVNPQSYSEIKEFLDQFEDPFPLGIIYARDTDQSPQYQVIAELDKVRPAAVPISQATTFDLTPIMENGLRGDAIRVTIDEIQQIRTAEQLADVQ